MAKVYQFRFTIRRAIPTGNNLVSIPYGCAADVYSDVIESHTFEAAKARIAELSAGEKRYHAAFMAMANKSERKPAGFNTFRSPIFGGEQLANLNGEA